MISCIQKLKLLNTQINTDDLARHLLISTATLGRIFAGAATKINLNTLEILDLLHENLRNNNTLPDLSTLLPTSLKPQFRYIAMHSARPYQWAWSAFTIKPEFDPQTGFWTIPKSSPEPQILISNHEYLPYDEAGPELALYLRDPETNSWSRHAPVATQEEIKKRYKPDLTTESMPPPELDNINTLTPVYPGTTNILSKKVSTLVKFHKTIADEVNRR